MAKSDIIRDLVPQVIEDVVEFLTRSSGAFVMWFVKMFFVSWW